MPSANKSQLPPTMPAAQPATRAGARNQPTNRPNTMAGKVCSIQTPPSGCRLIANWVGTNTKISAPTLTKSDAIFATFASACGVTPGFTYGFQKLRVNRFAAPIDITAAGTNAPIAIAAKANPVNQLGNSALKSAGTTSLSLLTAIPAA